MLGACFLRRWGGFEADATGAVWAGVTGSRLGGAADRPDSFDGESLKRCANFRVQAGEGIVTGDSEACESMLMGGVEGRWKNVCAGNVSIVPLLPLLSFEHEASSKYDAKALLEATDSVSTGFSSSDGEKSDC